MLWFAMLIPVITILIMLYKEYKLLPWEYAYPFIATALIVVLGGYLGEMSQTLDYEYWGGWVTRAEHSEPWSELKTRTVSYTVGSGQNQTTQYRTETYTEYHPEKWWVVDSNNDTTIPIDSGKWEALCQKFGNKSNVRLFNPVTWETKYMGDKKDVAFEPVVTQHSFKNRVKASDSIYKSRKVDPKIYGLFEYPRIENYYDCRSVLGAAPNIAGVEDKLTRLNARVGAAKQIRMLLLVFTNQPSAAAQEQEAYWAGGHKNEFIVTVSIDKEGLLQWAYVISWTEQQALKVNTRNYLADFIGKAYDFRELPDWLEQNVVTKWQRKHFKDFDYLAVETPLWAYFLTFLLTLAANAGLVFWYDRRDACGW